MIHLLHLLLISLPWTGQACSCYFPKNPLLSAFQSAEVILQAIPLRRWNSTSTSIWADDAISYSAKVIRVWKGCSYFKGAAPTITLTTNSDVGLCGVVSLTLGTAYLFSSAYFLSSDKAHINLCGIHEPWNWVNASEVAALSANYTNCTCTPNSCAPSAMPNYICPDGVTLAGPVECLYNQAQDACSREIVQCQTCQRRSVCRKKGQFCSAGVCRAHGTCATVGDCWNEENQFVKRCAGASRRCKRSKCIMDCSNACPTGNCSDPCKVASCSAPHVSCVSNYCGGCRAMFYNASGHQVCTTTT